jgi:phosphoheptose isomerase
MSYEEPYAKAFPFNKLASSMLDPEMIKDTVRIVNEAMRDNTQVNLIINNRAEGNAPLIAQEIPDRFRKENQKRLL